ncbi:MAG: copper amine oxidase N-terminal domain-containing protein [Bacillota bacterium]
MIKSKVIATAAVCAALVVSSAGVAVAKENGNGNGNGPRFDKGEKAKVKIEFLNNGKETKLEVKAEQREEKKFEFKGKSTLLPQNVYKEGRVLIPVNAITNGLGAEIKWNLPDSVTIEKDGKSIVIDLKNNVALVNGTKIELGKIKNGNGRITISPGLIKKLLGAAQKEGAVSVIAEDLTLMVGQEKEFTVSASNPQDGKAYDKVRFKFTVANASLGDIAAFQYKEGDVWKDVAMTQSGSSVVGYFGSAEGFSMPANYSATTTFRLKMSKAGTYNADIRLVNFKNSEQTIARDNMTVTVNATAATITADDLILAAGEEKEFTISTSNPQGSSAYDRVLFKFTSANTLLSDIVSFQYKDGDTWRDISLSQSGSSVVGYFGPAGGFPLPVNYSATTNFRLKMAKAGTYSVNIKLVDLNNNEQVITQDNMSVEVRAAGATLTADNLSLTAGLEKEFTVSASNPAHGKAYERVLYKFTVYNASLSDITAFRYKEGDTWRTVPLSQSGSSVVGYFGPGTGFTFPANYNATSTFSLNMSRTGTYNAVITLVDLNNNEQIIVQDSMTITVN